MLREVVGPGVASVGYELRLHGMPAAGSHPSPGSRESLQVFEGLRVLALAAAAPDDGTDLDYDIVPFDGALHLRRETGWCEEVELTVRILQRHQPLAPIHECETRGLHTVAARLEALGVQPRVWARVS